MKELVPIEVFLHAVHGLICPLCGAIIYGQLGFHETWWKKHQEWHEGNDK